MTPIPQKFRKTFEKLREIKIPFKVSFVIIGVLSTLWFLIRVIPKPSRALYPCMKAAAPIMSSFVIYLMALSGSVLVFRKAKSQLARSKYVIGAGLMLLAISIFAVATNFNPKQAYAQYTSKKASGVIANTPYGEPRGIFPGRVVWAWDPDATVKTCTNAIGDGYFLAKNNDQAVINGMLDDAVKKLTSAPNVKTAWSVLFKSFNDRKGIGREDYVAGQTIFIKVNLGGGSWLTKSGDLSFDTDPAGWKKDYYGMAETSPAAMIAVLNQLVNVCGVPQQNIYLGDPISHIYKHVYDQLVAKFPNVKYVDFSHADIGRTKLTIPADPIIYYSDKGDVMPDAVSDKMYTQMQNADYIVNIAALKAHARGGVTLNTKNNFGSHTRAGAGHLHNGLIAPENDIPERTEYGMYRVLTDLMGHENLGGNTVLFMIDGLWGGTEAVEKPVKWTTAPFNSDWPNSIFVAQDPVAIESVCMDFLRAEFTNPTGPGKARPQYGAVDDYLLQAADPAFWPAGIQYDPDGDGIIMGSLGICEHWNDATKKQYSRNLGFNKGIELVTTDPSLLKTSVIANETHTNPVFDGIENDPCWNNATWYPIDQTWITWEQTIDSADFHADFKVSWSAADNLMYFLVKVTDDAFIDGYVYPASGYPDFDIVEIFIDEDKSGGLHVFDNNPTWGQNAENAFSYHLATSKPADGGTSSDVVVCDFSGTDWGAAQKTENYASHFPDFKMKRTGNVYTYEFSMIVFDDTYTNASSSTSVVTLTENKLMGMSLAYCDNDMPDGTRDNFFGSVWVPAAEYNDHWMNANGYGSVRLLASPAPLNQAVVAVSDIPDYAITEKNISLEILADLTSLFNDPDNDPLTFTIQCSSPNLTFTTTANHLAVQANDLYDGDFLVTVTASDGQYEASVDFTILDQTPNAVITESLKGKLNIYPNPVSDFVNFTVPAQTKSQSIVVEIYSMNGALLYNERIKSKAVGETYRMQVAGLKSGSFLLKIYDGRSGYSDMFYKK